MLCNSSKIHSWSCTVIEERPAIYTIHLDEDTLYTKISSKTYIYFMLTTMKIR
jgi:hypothetical protein